VGWWLSLLGILAALWPLRQTSRKTKEEDPLLIDGRLCPDSKKFLADVYADFVEYSISTSQSLDIICRPWAARLMGSTTFQKLTRVQNEKVESMGLDSRPSWILFIESCASGDVSGILAGRINGESFVGPPRDSVTTRRPAWPHMWNSGKVTLESRPINQSAGSEIENSFSLGDINVPKEVVARKFDGTLGIKGFLLRNIEVSGRVMGGVIPQDALAMGGWSPSLDSQDQNIPQSVHEKLWRTLVANCGPDGVNVPSWYRSAYLECLALHHRVDHDGNLNTSQSQNGDDNPSAVVTFLGRVQSVMWKRKFLTEAASSKSVLFGLVPPTSISGDEIFILFGCSVPVVPRQLSGSERCTFVAECYIHGMMDGEAIPKNRTPEYPYLEVYTITLVKCVLVLI